MASRPKVVEYDFNPQDAVPLIENCETEWDYLAYGYNQPVSKIFSFMDSYLITLDPHAACVEAGIPAVLAPRLSKEDCVKKALLDRIATLAEITQQTPSDAIQGLALSKASTISHLKEILADKGDLSVKIKALKDALDEL